MSHVPETRRTRAREDQAGAGVGRRGVRVRVRGRTRCCRRTEALEVRYPAAVGVGEEAHSRQRHCPWSKPVNVETWGHDTCQAP